MNIMDTKRIVLGIVFFISGVFAQESITLFPEKDNTLYESDTDTLSNGLGAYLFAGRTAGRNGEVLRRALMTFPVADSLPSGATIDSVELKLRVSKSAQAGTLDFTLHSVSTDWGEGLSNAGGNEGGGIKAESGDATWIHTFFDTDFWSQEGGDFEPNPVATQSVADIGFYTWGSTSEMVADVQSWLDNPETNYGWMLRGDESVVASAKRFDSKDNSTQANRPQMTIYYTPGTTSIQATGETLPVDFDLKPNFPNPFNPSTRIAFDIARAGYAELIIYNILGQKVVSLFSGYLTPSRYILEWNGLNAAGQQAPSGFYFYALKTESFSASRKMILMR